VEIVRRSGEEVGHALRWQSNSTAALLRSAAVYSGGLPLNPATIRLIGCCPLLTST
jgi:hypothetical protein